jgi:hypothetical protein
MDHDARGARVREREANESMLSEFGLRRDKLKEEGHGKYLPLFEKKK